MDFKGYRLDGLYRVAVKDVIDNLKYEIKYLKKKIKHDKYRDEDLEDYINQCHRRKMI